MLVQDGGDFVLARNCASLQEWGNIVEQGSMFVDGVTERGFFHEGSELFHVGNRSGAGHFRLECPKFVFREDFEDLSLFRRGVGRRRRPGFRLDDRSFGEGTSLEIGAWVGGGSSLVHNLAHAGKTVEDQTEFGQEGSKVTQIGELVGGRGFGILVIRSKFPNQCLLFSILRGFGAHDFAGFGSKDRCCKESGK